jgi:hypothetical protein
MPRRKKSRGRRKGHRRATKKQLRALRKARAARKRNLRSRGHRRHHVKGYVARRRKRRWRVPAHLSRETHRRRRRHHRRGAFDNPMGAMEFGIALFTGLLGYGAMSFGRRYLAAHKPEASGSLAGVMGEELAPMDWKQWLLGGVLSVGPIVGSHYIKNVPVRSIVAGFGFGAAIATLGKAIDDGIAMLGSKNETIGLLYAPEVSGQAFRNQQAPKTGTAGLPENQECQTCGRRDGLGKCCRSSYDGAPNRMNQSGGPQTPPGQQTTVVEIPVQPPVSMTPPVARIPVPPATPPPPVIPPPTIPVTPTIPLTPTIPTSTIPTSSVVPVSPVPMQPALPIAAPVGVRGLGMSMPNYNWGHEDDQ